MNIPYWLLRLLPMWEYICPKCRKSVKQNAHQCPHCGEKFPLVIRVPPTFLKDPKKLEAYVHKHVFPRVSEFERNYLTKYFTVIFSDGFESGDFSAWSEISGGGTIEVVNTKPHHGVYSAHFVGTGNSHAYAIQYIGSYATLYHRLYIYIDSSTVDAYGYFLTQMGSNYIDFFQLGVTGASRALYLQYRDGGAGNTSTSATTLSLDTWYCIEVKLVKSSTVGEVVVYLNDVEVSDLTHTGLNNDDAGNTFRVGVGVLNEWAYVIDEFIDCVVVADAYIGPEAAGGGQQLFTLINEENY